MIILFKANGRKAKLWSFFLQYHEKIYYSYIQSTPVISRLLAAKIRERELSGISRYLALSREGADWRIRITDPHSPRRLQLWNSMLSDNRGTYVSRISTHIDIAPATNHNKQY